MNAYADHALAQAVQEGTLFIFYLFVLCMASCRNIRRTISERLTTDKQQVGDFFGQMNIW